MSGKILFLALFGALLCFTVEAQEEIVVTDLPTPTSEEDFFQTTKAPAEEILNPDLRDLIDLLDTTSKFFEELPMSPYTTEVEQLVEAYDKVMKPGEFERFFGVPVKRAMPCMQVAFSNKADNMLLLSGPFCLATLAYQASQGNPELFQAAAEHYMNKM